MKNSAFSHRLVFMFAIVISSVLLTGCVTSNKYQSPKARQNSVDSYVRLGMAYLEQGSRDAARRNFEKALAIDSDSATANNGLALLYQLNGEVALSEKYYLQAIRDDADYTRARDNYGAFLYQQKRYQEAYGVFERVTEDLSYEGRAYALANLGRTALRLDRLSQAKSLFEHSLNINSNIAIATIELAEIYFDEGNYSESKRYLDQYVRLAPRHSSRSLWLGIRLERIFGNKDKEASYVLALKNLHPYSNEYLQYQKTLDNEQRQ